ncbi:MAG: MFS transporter [Chloroflexota bacterium]|nr:MFS transporter [Chloroflexota bacterium]
MTSLAPPQDRAPIELPHRTRMEILGAVLLGIFLAALDQTIVGTALPVIVTDLQGNDVYIWAFTAYLVTATVSGPIYDKLSDLFGRRPLFMIGVVVFLLGSILSGLSQEMWQLIAFRGLQGLGAGALFPIALSIIGDIFAPSERGKYQGFFGAVFGLSSLLGPALGGLITDNFGWQWIFYVNVPIGAVVLYIIWRTLPTVRDRNADRHIDYLGASLFIAALVPVLVGLTNKQFGEWTDPEVGGLIALGLLLGAAFVWAESRAKEPIVPLGLFRIRAFTASVLAIFLAAMGFFAAIVFLPRWYQVVAGSSATESGYQILPLLGGLIVSAVVSGQIVARTGRYKTLILGALIVLAGGLFMLTNLRPDTSRPLVWLWMAVTGLGIGPTLAVFTLVVQNSVPIRQLGAATSNITLFQQVGGTVGLAITGSIFGSVMLEEVPRQMSAAGVPEPIVAGFSSGGGGTLNDIAGVGDLSASILADVPERFRAQVEPFVPAIVDGIHEAFSIATAATFGVGILTAIAAALVVLVVLPGRRMGEGSEAEEAEGPAIRIGELDPSLD